MTIVAKICLCEIGNFPGGGDWESDRLILAMSYGGKEDMSVAHEKMVRRRGFIAAKRILRSVVGIKGARRVWQISENSNEDGIFRISATTVLELSSVEEAVMLRLSSNFDLFDSDFDGYEHVFDYDFGE